MTLTTHIVTGATAARIFSAHPVEAFVVGWASHYILDSIPHWDYKLQAYQSDRETGLNTKLTFGKTMILDLVKVLGDGLLGFLIVLVLFLTAGGLATENILSILLVLVAGAIGGAFPDFLQFLYAIFKKSRLLQFHQKFHHFIHARKTLDDEPLPGITCQIIIILIIGGFFFASF